MPNKPIVVFCTVSNGREARKISRAIVREKLAACVNIISGVQSVFHWKGKIEASRELLLIIKTTFFSFSRLKTRIKHLHSYETPEIIALPISAGDRDYLRWIITSVQN